MSESHRGRRVPPLPRTITQQGKDAIVNKHNQLRADVSQPCTASNMVELTWDESLATASANWVRCFAVRVFTATGLHVWA
jgi:uncharacterized protein YkwD